MPFIYETTDSAAGALARYRAIADQRQTGPTLRALAADLADAIREDPDQGMPERLAILAARLNALACDDAISGRLITLIIGLTAADLAGRGKG